MRALISEVYDSRPSPDVFSRVSRSSLRLRPDQAGLEPNGVLKDGELFKSKAKRSKSTTIPKQSKKQSVEKKTTSRILRAQNRETIQTSKSPSLGLNARGSIPRDGIEP